MNWSRLELVGQYVLTSPLRIGAGSVADLALDSGGRPVIPASSFRGALRAYVESVLRGMSSESTTTLHYLMASGPDGKPTPLIRQVSLCCDSVDKRPDDLGYQGCLTAAIVGRWQADPVLRPTFDQALIACTCTVCRLFGAAWLAGRVIVGDLTLIEGSWDGSFVTRGGMIIGRDSETGDERSSYTQRAVPTGARFQFRLMLENATFAEQGIILFGLRAFEMGLIALGADRSRGLGRGRLEIDWWASRYLDADNLVGALIGGSPAPFTELDAETRINALIDHLNSLMRHP